MAQLIEHIGHNNLNDQHLVIEWQGEWYKLPFIVLADLKDEKVNQWLEENKTTWNENSITNAKELLKNVMISMSCYRMFA